MIRSVLAGGDRRSIGRADEVVDMIKRRPEEIGSLVECLWNLDPLVCMRAANATEKISRELEPLLQPYKAALLGLLDEATQKELRWHLALIVPRLTLTASECERAAKALQGYLHDSSSIVKTFAMQGLSDLIRQHPTLRPKVLQSLRLLTRTGTPAMRARGRLLLRQYESALP